MASRRKLELGNEVLQRLRIFRTRLEDFDVNAPVDPEDFEETMVIEVEILEDRLLRKLKIPVEDGWRLGEAEDISEKFDAALEGPGLTPETLTQLRDDMISYTEFMITKVNEFLIKVNKFILRKPIRDVGSILRTEKEFLSEKVPKEVAQNISSYVTGHSGAIEAQKSQLRTQVGDSGVPNRGGTKTKKNKSSKRKTHGRRV